LIALIVVTRLHSFMIASKVIYFPLLYYDFVIEQYDV
jgi:hypothetical protein